MSAPRLDVSALPPLAFGGRATLNWGMAGLIAIEGTVFAMLIASALYLRFTGAEWPPAGTPLPRLGAATLNVVVILLSVVPMILVQGYAHARRRKPALVGCVLCILLGSVFLGLRVLEFQALGCRWDTHAYGSITWTILGMHTTHMLASVLENVLFVALLVGVRHVEDRHWVDLESNAIYWYFVVGAWIPMYALVFLAPRVL